MMKNALKFSKYNKFNKNKTNLFLIKNKNKNIFNNRFYASKSNESNDSPSFVRGLFMGQMFEKEVFPFPETLTKEARENLEMIIPATSQFFSEEVDPVKNDIDAKISDSQWNKMKELGLFGLQVPQELGGLGLTNVGYARLVEVVGAVDLGVGIALGAHQSIGFKGILIAGNEEQKKKYLPKVASGEHIAAFCLTEPSSGSDANSIRSRAELSADGKHFVLNGSKIWISNGGIAEIMTVFAQTPVKQEDGKIVDKVTAFIVERSFGGVTNGKPENKMGIKCSNTAEVYYENVKIPIENVIGEVGGGFKVAMSILNNGRFGMGAALSGTMKALIKISASHANQRDQFKQKIREFGLIKEKIAQMSMKVYAAESMAYMIASNMDKGSKDYQLEAAISKVFASEAAWFVADETLQILGGMGFMKDAGVERIVRDLRIFRIFEGTNEILRLFVALTGMQSAGKNLSSKGSLNVALDQVTNKLKRMLGIKPTGNSIMGVHNDLKSSSELLSNGSALFREAVDAAVIKHRKKIVDNHNQILCKRISECAIDLFSMASVLSRASKALSEGSETAEHEKLLASTWCRDALKRVENNVHYILNEDSTTDSSYYQIATQVLDHGEYKPKHILNI